MEYRTRNGDVLDAICHKYYGATSGIVEQVLASNPGLSAHGPILPGGLTITLPDISVTAEQTVVRLWD
jgi:phage tail protein X